MKLPLIPPEGGAFALAQRNLDPLPGEVRETTNRERLRRQRLEVGIINVLGDYAREGGCRRGAFTPQNNKIQGK